MTEDERSYFYRRAEEEIERAQSSRSEQSVKFHYQLAGLYLDRVYGSEFGQSLASAGCGQLR